MVDFINENLIAKAVKGEHLAINWDVRIISGQILSRGVIATKALRLIFDQPSSNVHYNVINIDELKTIKLSDS